MGSGLWGPSGSGYRVSVGAGLENKPRKGSMVTGHQRGLAKKVSYQQDIISFPHKDSSLDGEVKCADSSALALGLGVGGGWSKSLQKSWGKTGEIEAQQEAFKGIHGAGHSEWSKKTYLLSRAKTGELSQPLKSFSTLLPDHFCCSFRL